MKGCCEKMCSDVETSFRIREKLVHPLERLDGGEIVTVREYRRSAAGQAQWTPSDLRTPETLKKTAVYLYSLLERTMDDSDCLSKAWVTTHEFINDRLRSIRQELVVQCLQDHFAVYILEECINFYLFSEARFDGETSPCFDDHLNRGHALDCLKQLLFLYSILDSNVENVLLPNRNLYECSYLLYNLDSCDAATHFSELPSVIKQHPQCRLSYSLYQSYKGRNYARYFRLLRSITNPILLRSARRHSIAFARKALEIMRVAYSSQTCKYPIGGLVQILSRPSSQLLLCLNHRQDNTCDQKAVLSLPNNAMLNYIKRKSGNSRDKTSDRTKPCNSNENRKDLLIMLEQLRIQYDENHAYFVKTPALSPRKVT